MDLLLEAFREVEGAELWIVGRPFGVDMAELTEAAAGARPPSASCPASSPTPRSRRCCGAPTWSSSRIATPSSRACCSPALAFGKAMLMSDVGGFPEVAAAGRRANLRRQATPTPSPGRSTELLDDPAAREALGAKALAAAAGPYSWDAIAAQHIALYEGLLRP